MADNDVQDFLKTWDLAQYIDTFRENDIDMKTLPLLTESMITELIPIIGHRARLKSNIEQWTTIIQQMPSSLPSPSIESYRSGTSQNYTENSQNDSWLTSSLTLTTLENCDHIDPSLVYVDHNPSICSHVSAPNVNENIDVASSSYTYVPIANENEKHENISIVSSNSSSHSEVLELLKTTNEGKSLLALFHKSGLLDSAGRRRLCNLLINKELRDDVQRRIPSARLHNLAYQISRVFHNERASTYFIPYISYGPGLKRAAKGKLLDCLNNRRREYRKSGLISTSRRSSTASSEQPYNPIPLPEGLILQSSQLSENKSDIEENLNWLRSSSDPWDLVEKKWSLTSYSRLKRLMLQNGPSISEYMSEFPCLKKPTGYLLILRDFKVAYPKSDTKLYQNFPIYKKKIIALTTAKAKKSKDCAINQILNEYSQLSSEDEEASNIVCLFCLAFLVGNSVVKGKKSSKKLWKPSKSEAKDGFITNVASNAEIEEVITRRQKKLLSLGHTLQPFIIIVGPSYQEITNYLVIVDSTIYRLKSILASVDCCFKIFLTLNAEYPVESSGIWYFLQKGFYEINTPWDKNYTSVSALLSDVGIPTV